MITLSVPQRRLYDFVAREQRRRSTTPSVREMAAHLGCCPNNVLQLLKSLEKKGLVEKPPRQKRSLRLLPIDDQDASTGTKQIIHLPLFGRIPAGLPWDSSVQTEEYVAVDAVQIPIVDPARAFALRVCGNSMDRAHILHGDLAILEAREARCNDVVAALVDGETTLKRLIMDAKGTKFLRAENPDYPDIWPVRELQIQGVMVGLVRAAARSQ